MRDITVEELDMALSFDGISEFGLEMFHDLLETIQSLAPDQELKKARQITKEDIGKVLYLGAVTKDTHLGIIQDVVSVSGIDEMWLVIDSKFVGVNPKAGVVLVSDG